MACSLVIGYTNSSSCYGLTSLEQELPWQAVKHVTRKRADDLRELGVYEKVDERSCGKVQCHASGHKSFLTLEPQMQIRSRIVARRFKSGDRPDLYAGTHPVEALRAIISIAVSHDPSSH